MNPKAELVTITSLATFYLARNQNNLTPGTVAVVVADYVEKTKKEQPEFWAESVNSIEGDWTIEELLVDLALYVKGTGILG